MDGRGSSPWSRHRLCYFLAWDYALTRAVLDVSARVLPCSWVFSVTAPALSSPCRYLLRAAGRNTPTRRL